MKVLVVDDDRELVEILRFALERADFEIAAAYDAPAALRLLERERPAVVILDINLGAWDGLELLQEIRRSNSMPIIMLTARDKEEDKIRGLELGADDYMTKPFGHRELIARIRAVTRRPGIGFVATGEPAPVLAAGPLRLDPSTRRVTLDGAAVDLTSIEFRLLHSLIGRAGTVVPAEVLLREVWGYDFQTTTDILRVAVHRLRRKLELDPANPKRILTVAGVGFLLDPAGS